MAVSTDFATLLNSLKVEDPWLAPTSWESIPAESGFLVTPTSASSPTSRCLYDSSAVTEDSLVRLAMNALQGLESSLSSIFKLCTIFRSDPTDRTFHRIPSLWNQSVSTLALEKILGSLGSMGCEVLLLHKFVKYFTNLSWEVSVRSNKNYESEAEESNRYCDYPPYSLVNQAFAVAVGDVLNGYIAALDTLSSSVGLRRLPNNDNEMSFTSTLGIGHLSSVGTSGITLLEVYLHTKELRRQIEVIGNICHVHDIALHFLLLPLEDLDTQTKFSDYPRGGHLLTYLYKELKVADPVHHALLKTLFIHSCEPYFDFIRSWVFKAKITDPFNEFIVAEANRQSCTFSNAGLLDEFPSAMIREQDGVYVPCFLRDVLTPLFRSGQQLQVLIKLLEFSNGVGSWNHNYEDFLPYWSKVSSSCLSHTFHLAFSKEGIEKMVLARRDYYKIMMKKLENHLPNLEFKYHQVIPCSILPTSVSNGRIHLEVPSAAKKRNQNLHHGTVVCDASSMMEELSDVEDPLDSSECSSSGEEEVDESAKMVEVFLESEDVEQKYLSALEFNSDTYNFLFKKPSQSTTGSGALQLSNTADYPQQDEYCDIEWPLNPIARNPNSNGIKDIDGTSTYKLKYPSGDALNLRSLKSWEVECANLMLGTSKLRERCSKVYSPSFDFMSIRDPFIVCVDRLDRGDQRISANSIVTMRYNHDKGHAVTVNRNSFLADDAPLGLRTNHQEQPFVLNVSGGGCLEDMPDGSSGHKISVAPVIDIPLDFVLEKCLLEDIQLQYIYVSKLTIKLLEEGFSLQEHLLALRRYHMMESADWADLFIVSLWHHKWNTTEADKTISEIQGILELSVQRSSCERDQYKDRLFVYMKEHGSTCLPAFATGIQSFNVVGLGYRVDWPISIVLTPGALKLYAQIFTFLIQVKLALSSLTDVWCSLKKFIHVTNQHRYSDLRKSEAHNFNIIVKLRHHIFHFVSTLQHYVQSQLSHVSWCRFLVALKHKVKDLADLNSVHMDYLNDSQCICFLSNGVEHIAKIIQSILQCALDLRSVVVANSSAELDGLNMTQVLSIKEAFDGNMRQLYGWYLNSPENVEFSLQRFWEYLNYNHHYSDLHHR